MVIPFTSSLRISNVWTLPRDLKARYLVCAQPKHGQQEYAAKKFTTALPRTISPFEVIIDFGPERPHVTQ